MRFVALILVLFVVITTPVMAQLQLLPNPHDDFSNPMMSHQMPTPPEPQLWGYVQVIGEYDQGDFKGFEVPVVRLLGEAPTPIGTIVFEHDFVSGLKWAALRRSIGTSATVTVGQLKAPAGQDFPPPWDKVFGADSVLALAPPILDIGVMSQAVWHNATLQVGVVNGEGPNQVNSDKRLDLSARVAYKAGPLALSGSWQRGQLVGGKTRDFRAGFATLAISWGSLRYAVAKRDDRSREAGWIAQRVDLRIPTRLVEPIVRMEWPHRFTVGLLRPLGWRGGIELEARFQREHEPYWCVGFQPAIDFLKL